MEKKIIKRPVYKRIEDGEEDVLIFVSLNGNQFESEEACLKEDEKVNRINLFANIKRYIMHTDCDDYPTTWYFPQTKEELDLLKERFYFNRSHVKGRIAINNWISGTRIETDGPSDYYYMYNADYVREQISEFLEDLPK